MTSSNTRTYYLRCQLVPNFEVLLGGSKLRDVKHLPAGKCFPSFLQPVMFINAQLLFNNWTYMFSVEFSQSYRLIFKFYYFLNEKSCSSVQTIEDTKKLKTHSMGTFRIEVEYSDVSKKCMYFWHTDPNLFFHSLYIFGSLNCCIFSLKNNI